MLIEIKSRFTASVLFAHEAEGNTLKLTVEKAVSVKADLRGANLRGAYLGGANLRDANAPIVPNIDAAILAAIEAGGKLEMDKWHSCGMTHCRGGWAITLAGEPGRELEQLFGPAVAGSLIYAASRPDKRIPDFYASTEDALADIRAAAGVA